KNAMGQSNVWYADNPVNIKFKENVLDYIDNYKKGNKFIKPKSKAPKEIDPYLRIKIEKIAISLVKDHYTKIGYTEVLLKEIMSDGILKQSMMINFYV
ncbi:MAG: hypothetical protein L6290_11905, partial [Thermodesulfovibrionales bacterium]|nr:hypothetical protein [Thermodesulfovibrionales bacterium]